MEQAEKYLDTLLFNDIFSGIINYDEVLDILNMKKRIQQAKKLHTYKIYHTETSGYFTYFDDAVKGKIKVRRSTEDSLWEKLSELYIDNSTSNIKLPELYAKWLEWKTTPNNGKNIRRIQAEWKAYYANEPLSRDLLLKPVAKITTLDLRMWAESLMKKHMPDKKKFSRMFSIINQCMEFAADEDIAIIPENIWQKARKKLNKSLIVSKPTPSDETQVFTDDERRRLKAEIYADLVRYAKTPTSAGFQILFLFETGLRIGECCGLKWSDVYNGYLRIERQADNNGVYDKTKTVTSCREIPLTKEALRLLDDIAAYNKAHGFDADWIFQSGNPDYDYRLSSNAADRKLRKLCNKLGIVEKSPHKCRKTCISTLLDSPDINNRTVQRFAGHKELSTTYNYYNFERKSKEEQAKAIDSALAL